MNSSLQIFENAEFGSVRSVMIDGEPWLVGKDVATALGYAKARNAISTHVDDEDKKDAPIQGTLGGEQNMTVINESGVYALIMGSKLPNAKRFKRWVTSEVLPALRKTGSYTMPKAEEPEDDFTTVCRALQITNNHLQRLQSRNSELECHNEALEAQIERDKPKVEIADAFFASNGTMEIRAYAKDIGVPPNTLFRWMRKDGWLMYTEIDGRPYNIPQQKAIDKGYMETLHYLYENRTKHGMKAMITPKGAVYFRKVYGDCETDEWMEV